MVKNDYMVKEDGNLDTLTTYPMEMHNVRGYSVARAAITGDIIELTGVWGRVKMDDIFSTRSPNRYQPIVYYKGSKTWRLLMNIASLIGTNISYAK